MAHNRWDVSDGPLSSGRLSFRRQTMKYDASLQYTESLPWNVVGCLRECVLACFLPLFCATAYFFTCLVALFVCLRVATQCWNIPCGVDFINFDSLLHSSDIFEAENAKLNDNGSKSESDKL
jgi:hypothetical protein